MGLPAQKIAERESAACDSIPYSHHITPTIISTTKAEYLSVWKLDGRPHTSASQEDVFRWTDDLNNLLRGTLGEHFSVWSHVVRRRVEEYPDAEYENVFAKQLNDKYRATFAGSDAMVNDLYLTLVWRPNPDKLMGFLAKSEKLSFDDRVERQSRAIKALEDANRALDAGMARYGPRLLGVYDRNGLAYSEALEFLALLVNGEHKPMPVLTDRFREYMVLNRPLFAEHGEIGEIRNIETSRYFGMLEIADYADATEPGVLNCLLHSDCEFVLSQSFSAMSLPAAKGLVQKKIQQLTDANDVAIFQREMLLGALNDLVSGEFIMGEHHASLLVWGARQDEVRHSLAEVATDLLGRGIVPKVSDMALEANFWAQLPGNWGSRPRPTTITSQNFLCFSAFHNFMRGKPSGNPWGPAVTLLKTTSRTPLYFNFHSTPIDDDATDTRPLGNTMIIGQSGSGKTVLLGFLLTQLLKVNPTIVAFDKDRGMEVAIRAMGGMYLPLQTGVPSGFNPFQMEPTPANLVFLRQFVEALASGGGVPISHKDSVEIEKAIAALMGPMDAEHRRLSTLLQYLPNPEGDSDQAPTVHARLKKWAMGGELGWLFDNPTDAINLDSHRVYGFDVTEFLDNAETRSPIMMYLLHRTEAMIDGRRFVYVLDEFWKLIGDPYFEDLTKNKLKTIRKQNGIFVFATQEPGDALRSPIAKTLVQQCATFVLLPNPKASEDDYGKGGLGLTKPEFELVQELGETSRQFVIKQAEGSAIAELNLRGFDDELLVLSGTPDNAELVERIVAENGDDPATWLPIFYRAARKGA